MQEEETPPADVTVNPGYAGSQIAKALTTLETHHDPQTRERAQQKVYRWLQVLTGMFTGKLSIGSRRPISEAPVWATPEVITGGFATGQLLASGPMQSHEVELWRRLSPGTAAPDRQSLNSFYLTEDGLAELNAFLASGRYCIQLPEEGALLTVAWLVNQGHAGVARDLIDSLTPYFSTFRFYPLPSSLPMQPTSQVWVEDAGTARRSLQQIQPNPHVATQAEAIQVWTRLYDRLIAMFSETVDGELPMIQPDREGRWVERETKRFLIAGGWPCAHYPEGWSHKANELWNEIEEARATHRLCRRPNRANDSFAQLHHHLKRCANAPRSLTGRDVGKIRLMLARHTSKCGVPGTAKFQELRARQASQVARPLHYDLAQVVERRLSHYPQDLGVQSIDEVIQPVLETESIGSRVPAGTLLPGSIVRKAARCLSGPLDSLITRGTIKSGDVVARIIPKLTAGLQATFEDQSAQLLFNAIYRAFRQRRSLLLLNLEHQVRLSELPWVAALGKFQRKDQSTRDLARQMLQHLAATVLRAFPFSIIPNKLLQEFVALAKSAEIELPLLEELAADIFMDALSPKFTVAAKRTAEALEGSLYARYYGVNYTVIRGLSEPPGKSATAATTAFAASSDPLLDLCIARADLEPPPKSNTVRNGMVLEQVQIVTTQNLAVLFHSLNLTEALSENLPDMARQCFRWICRRQQVKSDHQATLIMLKNTAYAWRQMIFYLSHLPDVSVEAFLNWAQDHLAEQTESFRARFAPALEGLIAAHHGTSISRQRRFVGWTNARHWILG